ncbi:hypothetical protein, partial [Phascolarctobacterium faecium]|uniref:hypothetical protein n=1 Tax=Phascolarctobacterium faecium TaxID=33025 RepID=UPI003AB51DEB
GKRFSFKKRSPAHSFLVIVQFSRFCLPPHFGDLYIIAFPVTSVNTFFTTFLCFFQEKIRTEKYGADLYSFYFYCTL